MGSDRTRIVRLDAGQLREEAENTKTGIMVIDQRSGRSFEDLFIANYQAIRKVGMSFRHPGVAVIAIDAFTGVMAGSLCVAAKAAKANSAIVGRHSMCDLFLESDPSLSLRHLAVIVDPMSSWARNGGDLRFRVVDLRTRLAFEDEHGNRLDALVAEGPVFLRCGQYALLFLVTGNELAWPTNAADAWACIPERVYLDEREAEPDRWQRRRPRTPSPAPQPHSGDRAGDDPKITHVQQRRGPTRLRASMLRDGELPLGTLHLRSPEASQAITLGPGAAAQGLLLGRYDRCDASDATVLTDPNISRVHVLLIEVANVLYAIDVASTNGTWRAEHPLRGPSLATGTQHDIDDGFMWREVRLVELKQDTYLALGEGLAYVSWTPEP